MLAERHDLLARVLGQLGHELRADVGLGKRDAGSIENHIWSFPRAVTLRGLAGVQ